MSEHTPIRPEGAQPVTLADLFDRACAAAEAFNAIANIDCERWNELNAARHQTEMDLRAALATLGADKQRLDRALRLGVIW